MLSIEEIKLLIEKLEKMKSSDFQKLLETNLNTLKDLEMAIDANNSEVINRLDKTPEWFFKDVEQKKQNPNVDPLLYRTIQTKIFQFSRTDTYHSLEIGPGAGTFSKEFRAWKLNYFLDVLPELEQKIRRRFHPAHQKYLRFFTTTKTECMDIPSNSCNFIFSWDTFVFFTKPHIKQYLQDMMRVLIPGGYCMIQYADCHYNTDLEYAKRGYWNFNTKPEMEQMIKDAGYELVEISQFQPGANFAIFRKPGKQNTVVYKVREIKLD